MMSRVTGVLDPAIEARGYDKIRSIVEIDLVDGRTLIEPADERYRGGPDKPFTRDELHGKFRDCAELVMSDDQITRALASIESVETMANVQQLVRALAPAMV
jgi:2-methylcitrate dehydratase PrpD